jgi:regulatory protein
VEEIISILIENNYLNEERFAKLFAGGKFRMKHWGRKKIQYELQQKGVSSYLIKLALKEIEEEAYNKTLQKLAAEKWKSLLKQPVISKQAKTYAYLLQKGFEPALINTAIAELKPEKKQ